MISDWDKPKVLIVDDREDKLLSLTAVLEGLELELVIARSGKEALRQVLVGEFAVILLDVNMPVMDGFETAALIRQRSASEHTPIIFVTGMNDTDNHLSRGYSLGAVDYIFSPVVPSVLRAKISAFIDLFRRNREIHRRSEALRDQAERRATDLGTRLGNLLNQLNVGVFRRALDGRLIHANPAFFRIFGMNPDLDPGSVDLAQLCLDPPAYRELLAHLERDGRVREIHLPSQRVDGKPIWISLSKTLVTSEDGTTLIDGLIEDVTQRHEAETVLITKAEELARSNAELEQFAYVASHDLQEPLRMVSTFSSLLTKRYATALDDQGRHLLNKIVEGATRMQQMVRDILSYSRNDQPHESVDVDCHVVLERALFNLQGIIEETQAEIEIGHLPVVHGDAVLLGQVFQNLLSNSLKFRRRGIVPHLVISARRTGSRWWVAIADNGIGIAPQHTKRIFDIFQRLHHREEYDGTGIGLAVCRKVIQRHGGEITVESTEGVGSVFSFSLPAALGEMSQKTPRP